MRKPQPHAGPQEVPVRKSFLLLADEKVLNTGWEECGTMAPSSQIRPLVAKERKLYLVTYGKELGAGVVEEPDDDRFRDREADRGVNGNLCHGS